MHRLVCVCVFALCLYMYYSNFDKHHDKDFHRAQCTEPITLAQRCRFIVLSPMKIFIVILIKIIIYIKRVSNVVTPCPC